MNASTPAAAAVDLAAEVASDALGVTPAQAQTRGAMLIDVRRAAAFAQATTMLPGAVWRDPAQLDQWAGALPKDRELIVYCVHGHEVSRTAVMQLRARGLQAHFLLGGITDWQAAALPLVPKPD